MMVEHAGVGLVAVIGVADERMGEVGAAFVVPSPQGAPTEQELIAGAANRWRTTRSRVTSGSRTPCH